MADILGAIANPQLADIAGALDYRQKKLDDDEARRKEIRMNQLAGQALSSGLVEGTPLHTLATENPKGYLAIAKSIGVDPADGSGVNQMTVDANIINRMANAGDIGGALNYVQTEIDRRKKMGLNTKYLEDGLKTAQQDPHAFFNAVEMLDNSFNPPKKADLINIAAGGMVLDPSTGKIVASNPKADSDGSEGGKTTSEEKNWAKYQELLKTDPAQAEQFARATRFSSTEGQKLSSFAEKEIATAGDQVAEFANAGARYKSLAEKLRASSMSGGLASKWTEFLKEQSGNQDEITALRKEALSITNSEAIKSLPPGPATDRDIELARAPFPTEKADPIYVANWLNAIARLNEKKAEYAEFKANFIGENGTTRTKDGKTLVSAWKDYQKENVPPPATLDELVSKYAK